MPGDQTVHRGRMQPPFLHHSWLLLGSPQLSSTPPPQQHSAGLLSEASRAQALAKQPSWGFTQRVCCPDCGLFMGSYIKSARFSAKSYLSLGKLHLCHLFQPWFTHIKQNTCKSFPFSTSPGTSKPRQSARVVKWVWNFNSGQRKVPTLQSLEGMILYLINLQKMLPRNCLILHRWWQCFFYLINGVLEFSKGARERKSSVL